MHCVAQLNEMRLQGSCFMGACAALPCSVMVAQSSFITACPAVPGVNAINRAADIT
jgi:hypothetical protein